MTFMRVLTCVAVIAVCCFWSLNPSQVASLSDGDLAEVRGNQV